MFVEIERQQLKTHYETKHSLIYCKTVFQCALQFVSILDKIPGLKQYRHYRHPPALRDISYCASKINL
jgi:hypothetical protein